MTVSGDRLLQTPRARRWLEQFDPRDRGAAELLVRSLILVSTDDLENTVVRLIRSRRAEVLNDLLREGESESPIALYAIREVERYCEVPKPGRRPRYNANVLTRCDVDRKHRTGEIGSTLLPLYFETCKRNARASPVGTTEVGSEGGAAYLIKRLWRQTRRNPSGFLAHPSLDKLREKNCRDVFLIDDLIGSGSRTSAFIPAFCRHPTVASWLSGKFLRISVIAFAATAWGLARTRATRPRVSAVRYEHGVLAGGSAWSDDRRAAVIDLCQRYGERTGLPQMALGYRSGDEEQNGLCCIVFSYKCPNNAPSILWAGNGDRWMPLFPAIPSEGLLECFRGGEEDARQSVLLALLRSLQGRHRRTVEEISRRTGLGVSVCQRHIEWCELNALIDERLRLTRAGRRELQHLEELQTTAVEKDNMRLAEPEPFYYPTQLRASRG